MTSFIVEAGSIGWVALIATSGTGAPMRCTTTLIDDNGTCARASAAITVTRKRTRRHRDALLALRVFAFDGAVRGVLGRLRFGLGAAADAGVGGGRIAERRADDDERHGERAR